MNKPKPPNPPAPDLLGPVVEVLKTLTIKQKIKVGEQVGTSITTLNNIQRDIGSRGPNYKLVSDLYVLLVSQQWRPAP